MVTASPIPDRRSGIHRPLEEHKPPVFLYESQEQPESYSHESYHGSEHYTMDYNDPELYRAAEHYTLKPDHRPLSHFGAHYKSGHSESHH